MASGPYGTTGGWEDFINNVLNEKFKPGNIAAFAQDFKNKHGPKGKGHPTSGATPYKFGHFVDRNGLLTGKKLGQFMIDAGRRHWDEPSLDLLEYTITHSLTGTALKQITFESKDDPNAVKARAVITSAANPDLNHPLQSIAAIDAANAYKIFIICPQVHRP
jgi:hypothetical protein